MCISRAKSSLTLRVLRDVDAYTGGDHTGKGELKFESSWFHSWARGNPNHQRSCLL